MLLSSYARKQLIIRLAKNYTDEQWQWLSTQPEFCRTLLAGDFTFYAGQKVAEELLAQRRLESCQPKN